MTKREEGKKFLKEHVFKGLTNLNNGFDSMAIEHFSKEDFEKFLDKIEKIGVGLYGIELWINGEFVDVLTFESFKTTPEDPKWYKTAYRDIIEKNEFKENDFITVSASYFVPEHLLLNKTQ